ncbi:glyoxal oxidase [Lactifluus subvellereus]|nr:glyoxal oxidase [Lactifluus subvellereus]
MRFPSLLALGLAVPLVLAQPKPGTFEIVGDSLASAMMMFVGSNNKVYILDKVEGNPTQIAGHPVWASVWDIAAKKATPVDAITNPFCAAGMHLPNGSFAVFGGNSAIGPNGQNLSPGSTPQFDPVYGDHDGGQAIRIITSCAGDVAAAPCAWYDAIGGPQMIRRRWYAGAEPLANGGVVLIGGLVNGGFINRNFPNVDPVYENGQAEPTYEFYPPGPNPPQIFQFLVKTSGLNAYALAFLMPSGKMFVQAYYSSTLWDYNTNVETALPDMPGQIVRVYPASGANTMLPLTPANKYVPTIIFCGGTNMPDAAWGDYAYPAVDTWTIAASQDCHRITPEPADGSAPAYIQDDNLPFIALPDGTMLLLNGAQYGVAGYGQRTGTTPTFAQMPYGESLATGPVLQPLIYSPNAPLGSRFSAAGLNPSTVPRLYHSSAVLLPDGSVMVAGSNPHADVTMNTIYPTTYAVEYFYPPYFSATTRPAPQGIPTTLSYGGSYFDITVPASSYTGTVDTAAANTVVYLIRQGFTTHAMNMGQRSMQLNATYTIQPNGTIILHTSQPPPNPNLFQPGPAFLFVTINGIPSTGSYYASGHQVTATNSSGPATSSSTANPKKNTNTSLNPGGPRGLP